MQGIASPNAKIVIVQPNSTTLQQEDDTGSIISDIGESSWLDNLLPRFHGGVSQIPGLHHPLPEDMRGIQTELPSKPLPLFAISPIPLLEKFDQNKLHPHPPIHQDEHSLILVNIADLAKMACLSGDYVLLSSGNPQEGRICRVYGVELKRRDERITAWVSPLLLANGDDLFVSPLPPGVGLPPVAADATLCRLASPDLNDKRVLEYALKALPQYFSTKKRVVRRGDLIPIIVDVERVKLAKDDGLDLEKASIVYFKVTHLKGEAMFGDSLLIDPTSTHLLEKGMEFGRTPSGVWSFCTGRSFPVSKGREYDELLALVLSTLHPTAKMLNLSTRVLLCGADGVGKRFLIQSVARAVGINYSEINCFDLLGESEQKTEESLREVWRVMEDSVPVFFVLRNVDALSRMDKGEEVAGKRIYFEIL